jgi:hypothetical protein
MKRRERKLWLNRAARDLQTARDIAGRPIDLVTARYIVKRMGIRIPRVGRRLLQIRRMEVAG